jgi:hypothetical protein
MAKMSALPNLNLLPVWKEKLAARGILDAALEAGWREGDYHGAAGWVYPLHTFSGVPFKGVERWKALDRAAASQAYAWIGEKPDTCKYYWAKGAKPEIDASWSLYIVAGEPDLLTLVSAGKRNVMTFFGEGNIPDTLVADLTRPEIAVGFVHYLADLDHAGIDAAHKLSKALTAGEIPHEIHRLPSEHNGMVIKDTNDLWIACQFDKTAFWHVIDNTPIWTFGNEVELKPYYNYAAYAAAVEAARGYKRDGHSKWTKNFRCEFHGDDKHPSAGYNFDTHCEYCFVCGTHKLDELAQLAGVNLEDFNENAGKTRSALKIMQAADFKPAAPPLTTEIRTSDESLTHYIERLEGKHIADITAAPFPFTILHPLGGFCEILKPRKMVGVIGLSGGGKTSFLESMVDILRQAGAFHTLWWGKEWRWDEMSDRAVHRHDGLTLTQMARYEMYLNETRNGGKPQYGVKPSDELIAKSAQIARDIQAWAGKVFYIDKSMGLDETLAYAQTYLDEKKAAGYPVRVAVWDYASLFEVRGARSELEKISTGLGMVKEFGETNDLFTFVASQPRKDDAERVKAGDKVLTAEAAMYMNDHKFNLLVTLNPKYHEEQMLGWGVINVVKNSGGQTGQVAVKMDLPRLRWLDAKAGAAWE